MTSVSIERINPIELMRKFKLSHKHVSFNPTIRPQYRIIRSAKHDGTRALTLEMLFSVVEPLANMTSYFKPDPPKWGSLKAIHYEVGLIRLGNVPSQIKLGNDLYDGIREVARLPVRCLYIY